MSIKLIIAAYGIPAMIIALCIPMVMGLVAPNGWYGFRTAKTLSSAQIWYAANRVAGFFLILACACAIILNYFLWSRYSDWPMQKLFMAMTTSVPAFIVAAFLASLAYERRL